MDPDSQTRRSVPAVLVARGLVNAAFALWLVIARPEWSDIFGTGSIYAVADGSLGFVLAALLSRRAPDEAPPLLRALTFADAALRVGSGITVRTLPGISEFPVSAVMFFGAAGASAACLAVVTLTVSFVGWRQGRRDPPARRRSGHLTYDPFVAIGLLALVVVGYAFVAGPPSTPSQLRRVALCWTATLAAAFTIAGVGMRDSLRTATMAAPPPPPPPPPPRSLR